MLLRYRAYHDNSYSSLSYETLAVIGNFDFPSHIFDQHYLEIVACCDGIVCLRVHNLNEVFLWNPASRQCRNLTHGSRTIDDNEGERYNYGFGYDVKSNDYKVIQLPDITSISPYHARIYNLSSNSWRTSNATVPLALYHGCETHMVYTNGIYSWLVNDEKFKKRSIISFDMSKEVLITTKLPNHLRRTYNESLIALNQCVVLFIFNEPWDNDSDWKGEMLMLKDYGVKESWTKLYKIGSNVFKLYPMCFWKNGDILAKKIGGKAVVLNPKTQETKDIPQLDLLQADVSWIWFYKESLVSLV